MLRKIIGGATLCALALLVVGGAALAAPGHGAGTTHIKEVFRDTVEIEPGENPCNEEQGTLTLVTKNGHVHLTTHEDGNFWATGTFEGEVTFVPNNPEGVTYSGHFQQWFGGALNEKNEIEHFTSNFHLKGTDGSTVGLHMAGHVGTNGQGEVTVAFEKKHATCG